METSPRPPHPDQTVRLLRVLSGAATILVALAMFAAALGSGNPDTPPEARLPGWVDTLANVVSAGVGVLVLWPKTRRAGAGAAAIMMLLSMAANYSVDGVGFFLQALPFNLLTLALSLLLIWRHRSA